ncbi:MAG: hypothetical protein NT079_00095 [Candidatus Omnitrophica bacterium]|nr:hypothetical protein [Candidatus Omnitrophota bacterium]
MKQKRPIGVVIFATLLIATSVIQFNFIPTYERYIVINQGFPEPIIRMRFLISYALRIIGLASGIGIFFFLNFFRQVCLGLSCFSILTIYWRHPYKAFLVYTEPLYHQAQITAFSLETFTWISVVIRWAVDIFFAAAIIYYFTRPRVIRYFR